jgi:hypothetical protein
MIALAMVMSPTRSLASSNRLLTCGSACDAFASDGAKSRTTVDWLTPKALAILRVGISGAAPLIS